MVDLIPKKRQELPPWQKILFYLSFGFLTISIVAFFVIQNVSSRTKFQLDHLNQELSKEKTIDEINFEKEVLQTRRRIEAFGFLVEQRKPLSPALDLLEKTVHPQAFFSKTNFVAKDNKLWIEGKADNFQVLGQQSLLFREQPLVEEINLVETGIGKDGGVDFGFEIILDPDIFK